MSSLMKAALIPYAPSRTPKVLSDWQLALKLKEFQMDKETWLFPKFCDCENHQSCDLVNFFNEGAIMLKEPIQK